MIRGLSLDQGASAALRGFVGRSFTPETSRIFLPGFADIADLPHDEQRPAVIEKALADISSGMFGAVFFGLFGTLLVCCVCVPVQTVTAGYLMRRPHPETVHEHTPAQVRELIAQHSGQRFVWLRLVLAPYWTISFLWSFVAIAPVMAVAVLWKGGPAGWPLALLCVATAPLLFLIVRQFMRLALHQATRFQVHQAILSEHVDLLDRSEWFTVDWLENHNWLRREWEFGCVTRAQGILFLDETSARFIGRTPNGDRVDLAFSASTARVNLPPIWLERLRTLGGRITMHGGFPGVCITTDSGKQYYFRAQRLFGVDVGAFPKDSNETTKEVFEALKRRLPEGAS